MFSRIIGRRLSSGLRYAVEKGMSPTYVAMPLRVPMDKKAREIDL